MCCTWLDKLSIIIFGENEIASRKFSLKNMRTGESKEYSFEEKVIFI